MVGLLGDTKALDERIDTAQKEIDEVVALNSSHIRTYAATGADKERYEQKAAEYDSRFQKAEARLAKLKAERDERSARSRMIPIQDRLAEAYLHIPIPDGERYGGNLISAMFALMDSAAQCLECLDKEGFNEVRLELVGFDGTLSVVNIPQAA